MESHPRVLITGITGYKGSWVAKKLLNYKINIDGKPQKFEVRGLVRDPEDPDTIPQLKKSLGKNACLQLELVKGDILDKESLKVAVQDWEYVIHTAFPDLDKSKWDCEFRFLMGYKNFTIFIGDEANSISHAIDANINVIKAWANSNVKRLIIASSYITIAKYDKYDCNLDEESFASPYHCFDLYEKWRIEAERWALQYIKTHLKKSKRLLICFLNPGLLLGPILINRQKHSTIQLVRQMMTNQMVDDLYQVYYPHCDVRDFADAWVSSMFKARHMRRYALTSETHKLREFAEYISEEFKEEREINLINSCKGIIWVKSWFSKEYEDILEKWNKKIHIKNDKARKTLEVDFLEAKVSIIDMWYSLINHKVVKW